MTIVILLIAAFLLGLCLTKGESRKIYLSVVAAILYFPLGVILALSKRYK